MNDHFRAGKVHDTLFAEENVKHIDNKVILTLHRGSKFLQKNTFERFQAYAACK